MFKRWKQMVSGKPATAAGPAMSAPRETRAQTPMPPLRQSRPSDDVIDFSAIWAGVKARKRWIIVPTMLAFIGSAVAVNLVTPRYTGEARILLESRDGYYTRPAQDPAGGAGQIDVEAVTSQVQVMLSRDLAREAIKRIGLVGNPEFDSGMTIAQSLNRVLVFLGVVRHPADRTPEDRVLEKYYERLLIFPVARSRIIAIEFASKDAELAAKAANIIAQTYLEMQEGAKKDMARSASSWLQGTIEPLRKKVQDAEARVEEYRARTGLQQVGSGTTTLFSQQLADLSGQLASARSAQAESQAKAKLLREAIRSGRTFEVPDVANNDLIRRLIEQRVNLKTQLALEGRTLLPEHPRMKELQAQLSDLEQQLRAAAERTVRALENESRIAGSRVESLTAAIDGQRRVVADGNEAEVQLRALEREARTQREQLEQYMTRYREAIARDTQNASPADARVVSRAITPDTPSFPKKLPIIAASTLGTFLMSFLLLAARAFMADKAPVPQQPGFRGHDARAQRRDAPIGPDSDPQGGEAFADAEDQQFEPQQGPANDARSARIAGLLTHSGRLSRLSFQPGEPGQMLSDLRTWLSAAAGRRTPVTLAVGAVDEMLDVETLGGVMAEAGRVMLIDLTERHAGSRQPGLSEVLSAEAAFADVIHRTETSRLHVIHAGRAGREAVLQAPDLFALVLEALQETYDSVLIEIEPSADGALLNAALGHAHGALVLAGHQGNGHAVEVGYRLEQVFDGQVGLLIIDAAPRDPRMTPDPAYVSA
jgi:uncharacterized protein involved in exopolysaccharide biosynthesis